jgi:hypothetical protein
VERFKIINKLIIRYVASQTELCRTPEKKTFWSRKIVPSQVSFDELKGSFAYHSLASLRPGYFPRGKDIQDNIFKILSFFIEN